MGDNCHLLPKDHENDRAAAMTKTKKNKKEKNFRLRSSTPL